MFRYRRKVKIDLKGAEEKLKKELEKRGYKVVLEFTPSEVIKAKIGAEIEPYRILYVCNPKKFYEMAQVEYEIGSFAPCPLLLYEKDGEVYIAINIPDDVVEIIKEPLTTIKEVMDSI